MSLFEVPGWEVPAAPVAQHSKKRKRPAAKDTEDVDEAERMHTAQKNIEKLMRSLSAGMDALDGEGTGAVTNKKQKHEGKRKEKALDKQGKGQEQQRGRDAEKSGKKNGAEQRARSKSKGGDDAAAGPSSPSKPSTSPSPAKNKKKQKSKKPRAEPIAAGSDAESTHEPLPVATVAPSSTAKAVKTANKGKSKDGEEGLTALQAGLKKKLDGARFRWINEMLYKSDSGKAHELMSQDPAVFTEYHVGFRHQVESWPTNPVAHYISTLSSYPAKTVIADLGCGDAALARALVPKGMTVLSFDLVSDGAFVVEADTCSHVPLPGSEPSSGGGKSDGEGQVVDVVVCALSLMGTNWPGCIREAWRILRSGGEFKVAEVTSRFTNVDDFVSFISSFGFKLKSKDERNTHFTLFEFKKVPRQPISEKDWTKLMSRGSILKPCEYKRR